MPEKQNIDYSELRSFILENGIANDGQAFIFSDGEFAEVFQLFVNFCQTNLNLSFDQAGVCKIYFENDIRVNAFAKRVNGVGVIGVNSGTIVNLFKIIVKKIEGFSDSDYFIFQSVTMFLYYHEKGHLIQNKEVNEAQSNELYTEEYSSVRHLKEFDADMYACTMMLNHILEYCEEINVSYIELISLIISGLYYLFIEQFNGKEKALYFKEKSHPHPVIRLLYITIQFERLLDSNSISKSGLRERIIANVSTFKKDEEFEKTIKELLESSIDHVLEYVNELSNLQENLDSSAVKNDPYINY